MMIDHKKGPPSKLFEVGVLLVYEFEPFVLRGVSEEDVRERVKEMDFEALQRLARQSAEEVVVRSCCEIEGE